MRPRILFILHLPPPVHGAAVVGKSIQDSECINSEFDCKYINLTVAKSLEDIGRFKPGKIIKAFLLKKEVSRALNSFKPDLVYITPNANGIAFFKEYLLVQSIKRKGFKVVAHYHNKGVSSKQDNFIYNFLYRRFFKNIKVILLSERLIKDVEKYVDRNNILICPNGIREPSIVNNDNTIKSSIPQLLFLSNMLISKGVIVLLDALDILKQKGELFHCDFIGGETAEIDREIFSQEIIARHLQDCVQYHGKQVGDSKEQILSKTDIFIFPTSYKNETFGLVLLEAMQHSIPCITTDEGGIPDIVKDGINGLIVKKNNAEDLAEKISILLNDKAKREKMGAEGYKRYKEFFTYEIFENNLISILKECCGI